MVILDKELGELSLVSNARAKRIIVRYRDGSYRVTYPPYIDISKVKEFIESMRPNLKKLKDNYIPKNVLGPHNSLKTLTFTVIIQESQYSNYYTKLSDGLLTIICPRHSDFKEISVQNNIRSIIEKHLRHEANRILINKVKLLANEHGFVYKDVKINKSITRWGSCSSRKNINLSYRCMLLTEYLVDFVILHELCHTVEMNHGDKFWQLLDKVTEGKSKILTRELKNFRTQF